jgi:hypothetical protein
VKTPVDSTTYSAPATPHGISSGFLNGTSVMVMDMNHQVIKEKNGDKPAAKDSNLLLAEKKGLGVFDLDIMVLPLSVDSVILEHVCLQAKINQNVSHKTQPKKRKFKGNAVKKEIEGAFSYKGNGRYM